MFTDGAGTDVSIVGTSHILDLSIRAAEELEEEGISVEVVDLRSLSRWIEAIIMKPSRKPANFWLSIQDRTWRRVC
ncbi:MAG: transketolase C-terminal domain-containing protein [Bdellovibrionota bacterium]